MQKETGVHAEIIVMQCGKFYNKKSQMIMLLLLEEQYSIKEFINLTAKKLDLKIKWRGKILKKIMMKRVSNN